MQLVPIHALPVEVASFHGDGESPVRRVGSSASAASARSPSPHPDAGAGAGAGDRNERLAQLAARVERIQSRHHGPEGRLLTGFTALDRALGGGFRLGCVHEFLAPQPGSPIRTLGLCLAARAIGCDPLPGMAPVRGDSCNDRSDRIGRADEHSARPPGRWVLFVDVNDDFCPTGAVQLGLPAERLVVVRPPRAAEALWIAEQALRCRALAAVILPLRSIDAYVSRRLQLAAEVGGGLGLLLREGSRSGQTFAASRLRVEAVPGRGAACGSRRGGDVCYGAADAVRPAIAVRRIAEQSAMNDTGTTGNRTNRRVRITVLKLQGGQLPAPLEFDLPEPGPREVHWRPGASVERDDRSGIAPERRAPGTAPELTARPPGLRAG